MKATTEVLLVDSDPLRTVSLCDHHTVVVLKQGNALHTDDETPSSENCEMCPSGGTRKQSPNAAAELTELIADGLSPFAMEADDAQGATDCPEGCVVEPDGHCPHGFESAALTAGVI